MYLSKPEPKIKDLSQKNWQTTVYLNYLFFSSLFKVLVIQTKPLIFGFCMVTFAPCSFSLIHIYERNSATATIQKV